MASVLIDGEQAYPIYHVLVNWTQRAKDVSDTTPGLPEGRKGDSTSWYVMFKELIFARNELLKYEKEWWPGYLISQASGPCPIQIIDPADLKIAIKFLVYETWCPSWFSHYTFDRGLDDDSVLASFERYVRRIQSMNASLNVEGDDHYSSAFLCLMGAEDRWRWRGRMLRASVDEYEQTRPPCRCDVCKEHGLVRIDH